MDEPKIETLIPFPPLRRSHLQSETFRTLVRILSLFGDGSQRSQSQARATETEPSPSIPDNEGTESGHEIELEQHHGLFGFDKDTEAMSLQDPEFSQELMALENELEAAIRGNGTGELITDTANHSVLSLSKNQSADFLTNIERDCIDENRGRVQLDVEAQSCRVAKVLNSCLGADMLSQVPKPGGTEQGESSSFESNVPGDIGHAKQEEIMKIGEDEEKSFKGTEVLNSSLGLGKLLGAKEQGGGSSFDCKSTEDSRHDKKQKSIKTGEIGGDTSSFLESNITGDLGHDKQQETIELGEKKYYKGTEVLNSSLDTDMLNKPSEDLKGKSSSFESNSTGVGHATHQKALKVGENESQSCKVSKALNSSLDIDLLAEVPKLCVNERHKSSSLLGCATGVGDGKQLRSMEIGENEGQSCNITEAINSSIDKEMLAEVPKLGELEQDKSTSFLNNAMEGVGLEKKQKTRDVGEIEGQSCDSYLDIGRLTEAPKVGESRQEESSSFKRKAAERLGHENEGKSCKVTMFLNSSLDVDMFTEVPEVQNEQDKSSSLNSNTAGLGHGNQQQGMKVEKPSCKSVAIDSSLGLAANGKVEEGEISGDDTSYAVVEDIVGDVQVSDDLINIEGFIGVEKKRDGEKNNESTSASKELKENSWDKLNQKHNADFHVEAVSADLGDKEAGRHGVQGGAANEAGPRSQVFYGDIAMEVSTENQFTSSEKDVSIPRKKVRGRLTEERKEKKKRKNRIKRAEKNRKAGVKRLKLDPFLTRKIVSHCRHYLKGRCHQGAECKFSHDTVPLTKSTPCCHFARHACMKGDDCPYDHQLSKYPCNKYTSEGFCCRGDKCLFSHKMPLQEGSLNTSNVCKHDSKSSSVPALPNAKKPLMQPPKGISLLSFGKSGSGASSEQKQAGLSPNKDNGASQQHTMALSASIAAPTSSKMQKNKMTVVATPPAQAPKGISLLSCGKSAVGKSSEQKQYSLNLEKYSSVIVGNQTSQSASTIFQKMNEISKKASPAMAPKGLDSLSFSQVTLEDHLKEKSVTSVGTSPAADSSRFEVDGSLPKEDFSKVNNQASGHFHTTPKSTPLGIDFLLSRKAAADESSSKKQASLPTGMDSDNGTSNPGKKFTFENLQNPFATGSLGASPLFQAQSSGRSMDGHNKNKSDGKKHAGLPTRMDSDKRTFIPEKKTTYENLQNPFATGSLGASPLFQAQSSGRSTDDHNKSKSASGQKALISTLAFAAKYETAVKMNRPTSSVSNVSTSDSGGLQKEPTKASTIWDLLNAANSKAKQ